jgi:hypothetical protein
MTDMSTEQRTRRLISAAVLFALVWAALALLEAVVGFRIAAVVALVVLVGAALRLFWIRRKWEM